MRNRTKIFLGLGAATMLALGGLAGLAQADMDGGMGGGMGGGHCGMARHHRLTPHGMMGQQFMERYDADKDGKVTQAEIDKNRQQWLAEADADKNGTLSLEEFKVLWLKGRNEMMVREFQFFDRDGNGQVTIEEYQGPMAGVVARRDRNDDGSLGADDHRGRMKGHGMGHGMGQGMGEGQGQGMGRRHGMMSGGKAPCMQDEGDAGQRSDAPEAAPGGEPATP